MVHCPECEATLAEASDVEFVETDAETGIIAASKRFYAVECVECGTTLGSGVAGAKAGGGGGAV
ncbi:hypothetical protein [Natronoarchaeum rubrum]|uniref:hypothetical protein n=1 Tax=Natronoarchaeum rubrum TaxID=755311 RepID=UPI0021119B4D|nr:hypothetical protein [Natronoarchaeum rubrum]